MTHNKKAMSTLAMAALAVAAVTLAGCSEASSVNTKSEKSAGTVLIINQPAGDPFSTLVYHGVQSFAEDARIPSKQIAGVQAGAFEQQIRASAQQGMNPVMVLWDDLGAAVAKVAPAFPNTKFLVMDSTIDYKTPNVQSVAVDSSQSAYIGGIVGASLSDSNEVGFLGGQNIPVIATYLCGFEAGVKAAKPDYKVDVVYAGTFTDPQKGQDIAASMKSSGINVIFNAANQTGLGMIKGVAANDQLAIGADVWQGGLAPGHVPWSALKPADDGAEFALKAAYDGVFKPGTFVYGARQGAKLYDDRDFNAVSPELQATVTQAAAGLKSGTVSLDCP